MKTNLPKNSLAIKRKGEHPGGCHNKTHLQSVLLQHSEKEKLFMLIC